MPQVTGFGGFFFKTPDPAKTAAWFTEVLGLPTEKWGRVFPSLENGYTVMGLHAKDSDYFGKSPREFMLNFRVDDLDGVLAMLREKGVTVAKVLPPDENGKFAHVVGPDEIMIELWEPAEP
jgi:catechol 2,3-dioxygenase-like lactoylglutathione lyase family enzyme